MCVCVFITVDIFNPFLLDVCPADGTKLAAVVANLAVSENFALDLCFLTV